MRLVTTCPSCGTVFRMIREQLDSSGGWVRCGHCMDVFDAKSQLSEGDLALLSSASALPNNMAGERHLHFVTQAAKQAFWSSSFMRVSLGGGAIALLCLFFAQLVWGGHFAILSRWPSVAPLVQNLCQQVACRTPIHRQIDAWLIDSSSFQKESLTSFRLSLVLKNTSSRLLLMPSIELSLLGGNDALLVRHVIAENSTAPAETSIAGGAERTLHFVVTPQTDAAISAQDITGYRLVLFYP